MLHLFFSFLSSTTHVCRFSWADGLWGRVLARAEVSEEARGSGCHGWKSRDKCRGPHLPKFAASGSHRSSIRLCGHHPYCPRLRWLPKVRRPSHDLKCEKKSRGRTEIKKENSQSFIISAASFQCPPRSLSSSTPSFMCPYFFWTLLLPSFSSLHPPSLSLLSPAPSRVAVMNVNGCECQIRWNDVYRTPRRQARVRAASRHPS